MLQVVGTVQQYFAVLRFTVINLSSTAVLFLFSVVSTKLHKSILLNS